MIGTDPSQGGRIHVTPKGTTPEVQEVHSVIVFAKASLTPSKDVIGLYPFALRPVHLGESDIPSKYIASSSCDSCAEASLCSV